MAVFEHHSEAADVYLRTAPPAPSVPWREAPFAVLGLETTGPYPHRDEIISLACVPVRRGAHRLRGSIRFLGTPPGHPREVMQEAREPVEWTWPNVRRTPEPLDLDFEPDLPDHAVEDIVHRVALGDAEGGAQAAEEAPDYSVDDLKRVVVPQVCRQLEFLDELTDRAGVERLIDRLLAKMDLDEQVGDRIATVYVSPERLTAFLVAELQNRRRAAPARFETTAREHRLRLDRIRTLVPDDGRDPGEQTQVEA